MKKKNRHSWRKLFNTGKLKHAECSYCYLQKWWDSGFGRLIYMNKKGEIFYQTPSCISHSSTNGN
jgi:hypothetical protein